MRLITTLFSISVLSIILVQSVWAAAPTPSEYPFMARLNAGPMQTPQVIEATVHRSSLNYIQEDFGNIQLLDDLNAEIPFTVFDEPAGPVRAGQSADVSASRDNDDPSNLFDDNRLTAYRFDDRLEANSPATVLVNFGRPIELHRVEIWPTFAADIKGLQLRSGMRADNLRTMKRRGEFEPLTDGDYGPAQFVEISLWGKNVIIEDINFYKKSEVTLYFEAQPERRYRLLYGDPNMENKRFVERVSDPQTSDQQFRFSESVFNPLASTDFDEDGVLNVDDNCPLISNQSQSDQDADRIGDPCDNAVEVKNFSQLDVDRDGVGDLIDNCKLRPNPEQKDKDNDGFGDECDNAYAEESVFQKWSTRGPNSSGQDGSLPFGFIGVILAFMAVAGIGITLGKKTKK